MFSFDQKDENEDRYLILEKLIQNWENEVVEFKEANNKRLTNWILANDFIQ